MSVTELYGYVNTLKCASASLKAQKQKDVTLIIAEKKKIMRENTYIAIGSLGVGIVFTFTVQPFMGLLCCGLSWHFADKTQKNERDIELYEFIKRELD